MCMLQGCSSDPRSLVSCVLHRGSQADEFSYLKYCKLFKDRISMSGLRITSQAADLIHYPYPDSKLSSDIGMGVRILCIK